MRRTSWPRAASRRPTWCAPAQASRPIRQGGRLARRSSSWPRASFWRQRILPCLSMPIRWKLFLPRSMPMVVTRSCRVLLVMGVVSAAFAFPAFPYPAGNTAGPCHYDAHDGLLSVGDIEWHVGQRLPELTGGRQRLGIASTAADKHVRAPVGVARDEVAGVGGERHEAPVGRERGLAANLVALGAAGPKADAGGRAGLSIVDEEIGQAVGITWDEVARAGGK